MDKLTILPPDLAKIPNLPPTAGITGVRTPGCTESDVDRRTMAVWDKVAKHESVSEFNRMWSNVSSQDLMGSGYLPMDEDHSIWVFVEPAEKSTKPLAEKLPDGRYAVNPEAIMWDDINRFNEALTGGPSIFEDAGSYVARCIRSLIGTPIPRDAEVMPYRKAVKEMLCSSIKSQQKAKT